MPNRREFLGTAAAFGAAGVAQVGAQEPAGDDRAYWLRQLERLAEPVLSNLAHGTLKRNMPVESAPGQEADRRKFSHLEAIGRLLAGIAPWFEAPLASGAEREKQQRYAALARDAIRSATDPASPDFLNFHEGSQPVVDAAFLAQALLRAPNELWEKLDDRTKRNLTAALRSSRSITPGFNNWLLFAAMVEAGLAQAGEEWDGMRVDYALRKHQEWYVGDGLYSDGPQYHWDYYNSYAIQPMLVDTLRTLASHNRAWNAMVDDVMARAQRYAAIQERLISPEGTFPAIGRSITY